MSDPKTDVQSMAEDLVHGLLSEQDERRVRELAREEDAWRDAVGAAERRHDAMQQLPAAEPSELLLQRTMNAVRGRAAHQDRFKRRLSMTLTFATAACALLIASLNVYFAKLTPSPYDLVVLGQQEMLSGSDASLRVRLVNRATGEPVVGAPVGVWIERPTGRRAQLAHFTTDSHGTGEPRFELPDAGNYQLRVTANIGVHETETVRHSITLRERSKIMLSTDKPVYQPGQTLHMRALALREPDLKPSAGRDAVFTVTDPRGNVIFKQRDVTSRFGIVAADCPTATEITHGDYTLACTVGDSESKQTVRIEPYTLPKYRVGLTLDQPWYEPGQTVRGVIDAAYFFGKPVAGGVALVEMRPLSPLADGGTIQLPEMPLDVDGRATFGLRLPDSLIGNGGDNAEAPIALTVTVTDTAGQVERRTVRRDVTTTPLRMEVITESGNLVADVANKVYVFVSYPDGRPVDGATIAVSGVDHELTTSPVGLASFTMTPTEGATTVTIKATDGDGRVSRRNVTLRTGDALRDFLLRTDKAIYSGGDTLELMALGGGGEPVFVDIIKDGQTVVTETIDLAHGRGSYEMALPPELFGTVRIVGYRFDEAGAPIRKSRSVYVRRASGLNITTETDRDVYRPGDRATVRLTLTDKNGRPTPGAISLAAVDEAVFSVLPQRTRPGMEQAFFTLDKELLAPINAIYERWPRGGAGGIAGSAAGVPADASDALTDEQRDAFEQAVFARTAALDTGHADLPPDAAAAHTLAASTFPAKAEQVNRQRRVAMQTVHVAWLVMTTALVIGAIGFATYLVFKSAAEAMIVTTILLVLLGIGMTVGTSIVSERAPGMGATASAPEPGDLSLQSTTSQQPPLRQHFPETLLWRPQIVTDDTGHATIDIDLADSITTWRLSGGAIGAGGELGATQQSIRVFQPFFVDMDLPVSMTRGDEVSVPIVVYSYLDRPQTVTLDVANDGWFELLEPATRTLSVGAHNVAATSFRIRIKTAGAHTLKVAANGDGVSDAIRRAIDVVPDGQLVESVHSGGLVEPVNVDVSIPPDAVPGSVAATLKIYPSDFSQVIEGLDAIFARPSGCFEQTSSTTYPNVLALRYLKRASRAMPAIEARARQYIHLGYQRLMTFEVSGGGFEWFGRSPASVVLTAYGLMEFDDMAAVCEVDPAIISRTREWLKERRSADGSWSADWQAVHDGSSPSDLAATAYVAWALFGGANTSDADTDGASQWAEPTWRYLTSVKAVDIRSTNTLALVCNALLAMRPSDTEHLRAYLDELVRRAQVSDDIRHTHWSLGEQTQTPFYGSGLSGSIETTATATLALMRYTREGRILTKIDRAMLRGALAWLVANKDPRGTWRTTQATVLALRALVAGAEGGLGDPVARRVEVRAGDELVTTVDIPADQADVVRQIDLSALLGVGVHHLTISEPTGAGASYQLVARHNVPDDHAMPDVAAASPLRVDLTYDRTDLAIGDTVTATADVSNTTDVVAPMVMLDLPIPAGFTTRRDELQHLVDDGVIARFEITPRAAIVYLRELKPGVPLRFDYLLKATTPVRTQTPALEAYEYYNPAQRGAGKATTLTIRPRA
ncbi:MAG: hypothetical protein GC159_20810 [Phycisphaera sp.]|nr:hypothetical protein [Phycisphaera sp.]